MWVGDRSASARLHALGTHTPRRQGVCSPRGTCQAGSWFPTGHLPNMCFAEDRQMRLLLPRFQPVATKHSLGKEDAPRLPEVVFT